MKYRQSLTAFSYKICVDGLCMDSSAYLLRGAPTATEQSWPGCPWGGFMPEAATAFDDCIGGGVNVCGTFSLGWAGVLSGAPTGMSQRWFGWPCAGLRASVAAWVVLPAGCAVFGRFRGCVVTVAFCSFSEQATKPTTATASKNRNVFVIIVKGKFLGYSMISKSCRLLKVQIKDEIIHTFRS